LTADPLVLWCCHCWLPGKKSI